VSNTVRALEADALIRRRADPRDQRQTLVSATPAGLRRARDLANALADAQEALLQPLSPAERRTLVALLRRLA
jgi:DNA-binding MarR family transcriptional regulator